MNIDLHFHFFPIEALVNPGKSRDPPVPPAAFLVTHEAFRPEAEALATLLEAGDICLTSLGWIEVAPEEADDVPLTRRAGAHIPNLLRVRAAANWFGAEAALAADPEPALRRLDLLAHALSRPGNLLDGRIARHLIRVLVVPSKTFYFMDKGVQRGATHDIMRQFEDDLNRKLAQQKKLDQKNIKVSLFFVPVGRTELAEALNSGRGDIVAAAATITDYGKERADFSIPVYKGVDEVVVSAPGVPVVSSPEELSGKEVFVRAVGQKKQLTVS